MSYAKVVVDITHSAVDRRFTYRIPDSLSVQLGQHVLVPFGAGSKPKEAFVVELCDAVDAEGFQIKEILSVIEPYPILLPEQIALAEWIRTAYHCLFIDALALMIPAQLRGQHIKEKREATVALAPDVDWESEALRLRSPKQREILLFLGKAKIPFSVKDLKAYIPNCTDAIKKLTEKGLLIKDSEVVFRRPNHAAATTPRHTLSKAQANAVAEICRAFASPDPETLVLHGVTGSGKTEVYLHAIEHCIQSGKQAIVLVPEISLTPQTVGRFRERFHDRIAVLHSRLSAGERFDEWRRIRLGLADIVIGARSAIFAPTERLGLILIDEEHESSYRSEKTPCYAAAEVAQRRIEQCNGTLVLGSATPQLLTYFRAVSGRYRLIELTDRVAGRPLPKVEIVNMQDELLMGNSGIFSCTLTERLSTCLANGQQAMLFINRRGYSTFVSCRSCGYVQKCDDCDISLTYHKSESRTRCHYCGKTKPLPTTCPSCGKSFMKQFGIGTEQVEEALHKLFPSVTCLRMDTDTMRTKDSYQKILTAFSKGEAQVLIGTQMIAKGHDFPNVTLVGIVAADTTLNLPDYRAPERTFQLLTQVAGRAGRDSLKGTVVLQTYAPQHPIIRFAAAQDYRSFYQYEIEERRKMLYPPFSMFLRVIFSDRNEELCAHTCMEYSKACEATIREALGEDGQRALLLLVAAQAPIARINGYSRWQLLIKLLRTKRLPETIRSVYAFHGNFRSECESVQIELNPQDMF